MDVMDVDEPYGGWQDTILSDSDDGVYPRPQSQPRRRTPNFSALILSSDTESDTATDSSDDAAGNRFEGGGPGAQPILGPSGGLAVRACRKSARDPGRTGGIGGPEAGAGTATGTKQKRLTTVSGETTAAVKSGQAEVTAHVTDQAVETGKKYETNKEKRKQNPDLRDLPFPLSIVVHLEQIELSLPNLPAQPHLQLAIVFRDRGEAKNDATSACSSSFPLRLPAYSSSNDVILTADDLATPVRTFNLSRLPPAEVDHRKTRGLQRRADTRPDLCEILLRLSISDGAAKSVRLVGFISLSSSAELERQGNGQARLKFQREDKSFVDSGNESSMSPTKAARAPAPVAARIAVSWEVKRQKVRRSVEDELVARARITDEEMRTMLEDELRRLELEWRVETYEREEFFNRLESSDRPPQPVQLDPDPAAPPPSSLWSTPNSATPAPASYRFAPVPRYNYISPYPRALPLEDPSLQSFPFIAKASDPGELPIKTWEDSTSATAKALDKANWFLEYELGEDEDPAIVRLENEARRRRYLDLEALHAPDPGPVTRNFRALRALLSSLGYTSPELSRLEAAAHAEAKREGLLDEVEGTFALQVCGERDEVLTRALRVFEERTAVSPWLSQQRYLQVENDPLIASPDIPVPCDFCGALFCTVHGFDDPKIHAFPELARQPVKPRRSSKDGCAHCGSSTCRNFTGETSTTAMGAELEALVISSLLEPSARPLDPCTAATLFERPVQEDDVFRYPSTPSPRPSPTPRRPGKHRKHRGARILPPMQTAGYEPCACAEGKCGSEGCSCAERHTWCDRFCGCPPNCSRRFPGCSEAQCAHGHCFCEENFRECDPELCECSHGACVNSSIRLGRVKHVQVVRSSVKNAGLGLVLLEPAKEGELIGAYGGEYYVVAGESQPPGAEWKSTLADTALASYMFNVDGIEGSEEHAIDSEVFGSNMRFINGTDEHSANCGPRVKYVAGTHQVGIYAHRNLKAGDELLMWYGAFYELNNSSKDEEACVA
ncbi:hypothetical protein JCM11251_003162 [Rhodosporidiobolus azoricus]